MKIIIIGLVLCLFSLSKGELFTSSTYDVEGNLTCPDPVDIIPCTCTVEDLINIDCSSVITEDQLKQIFSSEWTESEAVKLIIKDNNLLSGLHEDTFGSTQFTEIEVTGTNIKMIEQGTFQGSYETMLAMKFKDNKIVDFPFDEIEKFSVLESLDVSSNVIDAFPTIRSESLKDFFIGNNLISYIPKSSMEHLPSLQRFRAAQNNIDNIKQGTFSSLEHLEEINLYFNEITEIQNGTFVFHGNVTALFLSYNQIATVESNAFTGVTSSLFLDSNSIATLEEDVWRPSMENSARFSIKDNPLECKCDIAWLIRNDTFMDRLMGGATCDDGTLLIDLDPADYDACD